MNPLCSCQVGFLRCVLVEFSVSNSVISWLFSNEIWHFCRGGKELIQKIKLKFQVHIKLEPTKVYVI
jgi:hypothetical protein